MDKMQRISARCLRLVSLGSALVLTGFVVLAQAPPSADTFVNKATPTVNYGSSISLPVDPYTTTYIQFNLSGIPAGATISKATLRLYVDLVVKAGSFDVYEVDSQWTESKLTYNTATPVPVISATGGNPIGVTTASLNQFVLVDITTLAQAWINGVANNGVALKLTTPSGSFSFDSKESLLTANGPELEIALAGGGAQGPAGPTGPQGATGPQGPQGAAGPQGLQGPPGIGLQGPQGPAGKDGAGFVFRNAFDNTASYAVNDVVSYSGSSYVAIAANQGPNNPTPDQNVAWSLMAQQGAPGQAGQTGPQGAIGPAGPAGPQGAQGPQGPASTTGQSSQTAYQTNSLVTSAFSFATLPGLSFTVSVPANSIVIVSADGGVGVDNDVSPTASTVGDVTLVVDNVQAKGTFKRVYASNNSTFLGVSANWSFSTSMSLPPGPHTFSVMGRCPGGPVPAIIGGGDATTIQSELTVTILNQ